jgi:uncharacterized protein
MPAADLERLESILWQHAVPRGGMPLEMLDGFFSALVCGPELVMPSEYDALVWGEGEGEPAWETPSQAVEAFGLMQSYWNHIVDRVGRDPDEDPEAAAPSIMMPEPLLDAFEDILQSGEVPADFDADTRDFPLASGWAVGFFQGMELREDDWDRWIDAHESIAEHLEDVQQLMILAESQLAPLDGDELADDSDEPTPSLADIAELMGDDELAELIDEEDMPDPPTLIERLDIMFELPHFLHALNSLRLAEQVRARGPARAAEQPGRNDPCPCGSGKKFKKCHGAADRLH